MFKQIFLILILNTLTLISIASACGEKNGDGFLPKNNLKIATTFFKPGFTLSEETFNRVITDVENIYKPIITSQGMELLIHRLWNSSEVNASAFKKQRDSKVYEIEMYGGLARHPALTEDAFALVLCHELGHHLGGAPFESIFWGRAANEGQADYFAVTKCMRKYFESNNASKQMMMMNEIPSIVKSSCLTSWGNSKEYNICLRTAQAAQSLANLFSAVSRSMTNAKFETPSEKVVTSTYHDHPEAQCRLDTYFQGSLCRVSHQISFSFNDETSGACNSYTQAGARPKCWYKPKSIQGIEHGGFQSRRI